MKSISNFLHEKCINENLSRPDKVELQYLLDTEEDGVKILSSEVYHKYLNDHNYECTLVPSFVQAGGSMSGKKWSIFDEIIPEEVDVNGDVIPYDDAPGRSLTIADAKRRYRGKVKEYIQKYFAGNWED